VGWNRPWFSKSDVDSTQDGGRTIDPAVVRPLAESLADRFAAWPFQPGGKTRAATPWSLPQPPLEYLLPPDPSKATNSDSNAWDSDSNAAANVTARSSTQTNATRSFNPAITFLDLVPPEDRDRDGFGVAPFGVVPLITADPPRLNLDILESGTVWGDTIPVLILQKKTLQDQPAPQRDAGGSNAAESSLPHNASRDAGRSGMLLLGLGGGLTLGLFILRGLGPVAWTRRLASVPRAR
jgi:hypothetical protein